MEPYSGCERQSATKIAYLLALSQATPLCQCNLINHTNCCRCRPPTVILSQACLSVVRCSRRFIHPTHHSCGQVSGSVSRPDVDVDNVIGYSSPPNADACCNMTIFRKRLPKTLCGDQGVSKIPDLTPTNSSTWANFKFPSSQLGNSWSRGRSWGCEVRLFKSTSWGQLKTAPYLNLVPQVLALYYYYLVICTNTFPCGHESFFSWQIPRKSQSEPKVKLRCELRLKQNCV